MDLDDFFCVLEICSYFSVFSFLKRSTWILGQSHIESRYTIQGLGLYRSLWLFDDLDDFCGSPKNFLHKNAHVCKKVSENLDAKTTTA